MIDYLEILANNREEGPEYAATAKPRRVSRPETLTKRRKRAKLNSKRRHGTSGNGKAGRKSSKGKPSMAKRRKLKGKAKKKFLARMARGRRKASGASEPTRKKGKRKSKRKGGKRKSAKRVAAGKKAARTRKRKKAERAAAGRKSARKSARKPAKRKKARKSGKRRKARRVRAAHSIKLPRGKRGAKRRVGIHVKVGKRRRSRGFSIPRKSRKVYVIAAEKTRRRRRRKARKNPTTHRRRHTRRHRRGVMENPMSGTELFVGSVTGLLGFLAADAIDRLLATHALTDTGKKNVDGLEIYGDPQAAAGTSYAGLFNATAICAPMDAKRWIVGLLVAGAPLTIAHFISAPTGRAALQFFGFAAGIRIVGKGLTDLMAIITRPTQIGQQLYDGEMRAAILAKNAGSLAAPGLSDLPQAGLGRPQLGKAPCAPCAEKATLGYPSGPREVAPTGVTTQAPPPPQQPPQVPNAPQVNAAPPPPAATPPAPPAFRNNALTGVPARNRNRFNWGATNID